MDCTSSEWKFYNEHYTKLKGLKEIQNFNDYDKFYFLPLQLLSQGIERFLKSYFCLYYFMENNSFPKIDTLRSFSHDINQPIKLILEKYFKSYDREQYKLDKSYINYNQLDKIMKDTFNLENQIN